MNAELFFMNLMSSHVSTIDLAKRLEQNPLLKPKDIKPSSPWMRLNVC